MFNNNNGGNNAEWQPASNYNHKHVGYYLKQARESLNLTVEEVSDTIRVRRIYLEAIEEGRYDQLPGTAYAVGFVRIYANFLGLNSARVVEQFRAETGPHQGEVEFEFEQAAPPIENQAMPKNLIIIATLLIAILTLAAYLFFGRSRVENPITDVSDIPMGNNASSIETSSPLLDNPPSHPVNLNNDEFSNNEFPDLTLDGIDTIGNDSQEQSSGLLAGIPSNADSFSDEITIEDLIEGTGGTDLLNSLDTNIPEQDNRYGVNVNNYALPQGRGLEGWKNLTSVSIAQRPQNFNGGVAQSQDSSLFNNGVYAENAPIETTTNNANQNVAPIGVEPKLRILAKEDSYIFVFRQSDASELKIGRLLKDNSYVIPEGEDVLLTYTGDVVVVVDGQYEVPVSREPNQRNVLNYERLKRQAESLNTQ